MERLQRVLAQAGIASRRHAEELIVAGRVRVDGEVITELGTKVDPAVSKIEVDGNQIPRVRRRYVILHKPSGYITTMDDERGRYTVMDLVHVSERVNPVGRLDRQTEGLLLLTNDGELANRVMHPRYGIEKEYEALLDGFPPPPVLQQLRDGIMVDGQRTKPEVVRPLRNTPDGTVVRIVIHEGRNRIVRRMFEEVGYPVVKLIRVRVGPLQLGAIPRGHFRDLTDGELRALREAVHMTDEDVDVPVRHPSTRPQPQRGPDRRPPRDEQRSDERRPAGPGRGPRRDGDRRFQRPDQRRSGAPGSRPRREGDNRFQRSDERRPGGPPRQGFQRRDERDGSDVRRSGPGQGPRRDSPNRFQRSDDRRSGPPRQGDRPSYPRRDDSGPDNRGDRRSGPPRSGPARSGPGGGPRQFQRSNDGRPGGPRRTDARPPSRPDDQNRGGRPRDGADSRDRQVHDRDRRPGRRREDDRR